MDLGTIYLPLKHTHVTLVTLSLSFFAVRGFGVLAGGRWPLRPVLRRATMAIDTLLLASGAGLWALLGLNPVQQTWLGTKLLLLLLYIVLGTLALKRGRNARVRAAAFVAALACAGAMVGIALAHHPLGWWVLRP